MNDAPILYTVEAGVATVTFNRPEKLNALTPDMLSGFFVRVAEAAADPAVRVIVITGAGRGFCAGLDLGIIGSGGSGTVVTETGIAPQWGDDIGPELQRFFSGGWNGLITSRKPTIAAINGPAFGWGFILSLHCDIRFAARSAMLNATFARLGVPGEKGSAWLLARLVGTARASDLLYTARRIDGQEADRLGIVNAVFDDAALLPAAAVPLLLACEGLHPGLVEEDPWFAGWSGVLVNLSDIAAMGGRPLALVNSLWAHGEGPAQALLDGMVLARSAFESSMNYRCAMVLGVATRLSGDDELDALRVITEHLLPGRWEEARQPTPKERAATITLSLDLTECSLKIGEGLPEDDPDDLVDPVYSKIWAGTVPIRESFGEPITDHHTPADVPVPHYIANWTRP